MDRPSPSPRELKVLFGSLVTLALAFSTWAGLQLRTSREPAKTRLPAGHASVSDPAGDSAFQGRSPTGAPISPRLQAIADMADYLEQAEVDE
jgi:hypothetical protein